MSIGIFKIKFVSRLDQVYDSLGLQQVKAAIEKCPSRKLPRRGRHRSIGNRNLDQGLQNQGTAMAADFNGILAGIRVWSLQGPGKPSVDFPVPINNSAILNMADTLTKRWGGAENPSPDLDGPRPAQSHDSQATLPAGGGNSHDGF